MPKTIEDARRRAASRATRLLKDAGVDRAPVDVETLAARFGVSVTYERFDDATSGIVVRKGSGAVIGVNANHHPNRQRFTIAHELGHYFLHEEQGGVFVDEYLVQFRSDRTSDESLHLTETEANAFAAELLMPASLLEDDLERGPVEKSDERAISWLATRYGVSQQAMTIRLTTLGLLMF